MTCTKMYGKCTKIGNPIKHEWDKSKDNVPGCKQIK